MAMSTELLPLAFIEQAINRTLHLDPASAGRLQRLAGKDLGLRLTDPAVSLRVSFAEEGLALIRDETDMSDCQARLETSLAGLTGLVLSRGQRSRDVAFRGDIGTIQEVRTLFAELDVDLEAQLARWVGTSTAASLLDNARAGARWSRRSATTLLQNAAELATEERQLLPTAVEARNFCDDVDNIREDVDRLEARLRRLEKQRTAQ